VIKQYLAILDVPIKFYVLYFHKLLVKYLSKHCSGNVFSASIFSFNVAYVHNEQQHSMTAYKRSRQKPPLDKYLWKKCKSYFNALDWRNAY